MSPHAFVNDRAEQTWLNECGISPSSHFSEADLVEARERALANSTYSEIIPDQVSDDDALMRFYDENGIEDGYHIEYLHPTPDDGLTWSEAELANRYENVATSSRDVARHRITIRCGYCNDSIRSTFFLARSWFQNHECANVNGAYQELRYAA